MGKKVANLLLGIFVGLIPLVNLVVATIMAFKSKHKRTWLIALSMVVCIGILVYNRNNDDIYGEVTPVTNELALHANLAITSAYATGTTDTLLLDSLVKSAWQQIARTRATPDHKLKKVMQDAADGNFTSESHRQLTPYLSRLNALAQRHDSTIHADVLHETDHFVLNYMARGTEPSALSGLFITITYITGLCYCISLFNARGAAAAADNTPVEQPANAPRSPGRSNAATSPGRRPMPGDDLSMFDPRYQGTGTERVSGETVLEQLDNSSSETYTTPSAGDPVYINLLTAEQLAAIPGISSIQAKAIVQQRNTGGPFMDREDFASRSNLSDMVIDRIENQLNYAVSRSNNRGNSGSRVLDI